MFKIHKILLLSVLFLVVSCSSKKTLYFTHQLRETVAASDIDLKDIQFYNSQKIVIERQITSEETKVASGKIRFENGQFIERIIIKKNTPGICESFNEAVVEVAFEQGENRALKFVRNAREKYQISALEWEGKFGRISYDTTFFFIVPGSEKAMLKIKKEDITRFNKQERVASGRSVSGK